MMEATIDSRLDEATIAQLTWKHPVCRSIAVSIVQAVLEKPGDVFPDEVDLSFVRTEDANVVGMAWRNLKRHGIIIHGTRFRRSTKKTSNGRTLFAYTIGSRALAEVFLQRNKAEPVESQPQLI